MIRREVYAACAASFANGVFFVLVWAPHPWGWAGFDNYYDYGRLLARGEPFPTIDRPWGYAYYLAGFYRLFGDRPWIPLLVQVALNATMPLVVYVYSRDEFDERFAAVAAILTGVLSFNAVYASPQNADALSTVIFTAGVLVFARARRRRDWRLHAAAGALFGAAPQFRPNLILVPVLLAIFLAIEGRDRARVAHACLLLLAATAMLTPWALRNRRLTGELMFTTTHGAMQLWYGTLQTGPYLKSRAYNPKSVFETGSFRYTTLERVPPVVTMRLAACAPAPAGPPAIVYWTDRNGQHRRAPVRWSASRELVAELPPSPAPTVYYFYVDGIEASRDRDPHVFFVSADHLGNLDRHDDLLDVFDVVHLVRHLAWAEPVAPLDRLDVNGDGRLTGADVADAVNALLADAQRDQTDARVDHDAAAA